VRGKLAAIVDLHVLPPLNATRAVWTVPFFAPGTKLPSLAGPEVVEVAEDGGGGGGIKIRAPGSTAGVRDGQRDIYACKVGRDRAGGPGCCGAAGVGLQGSGLERGAARLG
jgi:hypothetical protein